MGEEGAPRDCGAPAPPLQAEGRDLDLLRGQRRSDCEPEGGLCRGGARREGVRRPLAAYLCRRQRHRLDETSTLFTPLLIPYYRGPPPTTSDRWSNGRRI